MDRRDRLSGIGCAEGDADLHRRVMGDEAHQFAADIAGGAEDRGTNHARSMQIYV
jgi:hypothetical protein